MIPAPDPITIAIPGVTTKSEQAPIATPPARVEFRMISMSSLKWTSLEIPAAPMQLAEIARAVLITTLC
jgi:hypothetical protein